MTAAKPNRGRTASASLMAIYTGCRDETWATPPDIFDPLHTEFRFGLDACASPENRKCRRFFDKAQDALTRDWSRHGAVWCNPPYGREIGRWVAKAWHESQKGVTVVCLVAARTDTAWWHDYAMRGEVRFLRGRIRFVGARHNAPFPSAIVIFRAARAADREE